MERIDMETKSQRFEKSLKALKAQKIYLCLTQGEADALMEAAEVAYERCEQLEGDSYLEAALQKLDIAVNG